MFFAWHFILKETILFWLTISYQKPFVFFVSVFCCRTCFSMGDRHSSFRPSVRPSIHPSVHLSFHPFVFLSAFALRALWAQLLLQFCTNHIETAYVFFMVWRCACGLDITIRLFLSLFPHCELSHFITSIYRLWVPLERNSSYSFILTVLKLCMCFLHGMRMCMWFGYNC